MHTEYSIRLTPSHNCVPSLMDFIIDHAEKPFPKRKDLVDMLTELDRAMIKQLHMRISKGQWRIEFIINEKTKFEGSGEKFNEALQATFEKVQQALYSAAM